MDEEPSTSSREEPLSPRKKRPRGPFSATEKLMLRNVFKFVYEEKSAECAKEQDFNMKIKSECVAKTAYILGVGISTVYNMLREYKKYKEYKTPGKIGSKRTFRDKLTKSDFDSIKRKVQDIVDANEIPNASKVHKAILADPDLPSFSKATTRRILAHLKKEEENDDVHATDEADETTSKYVQEILFLEDEYSDNDDYS